MAWQQSNFNPNQQQQNPNGEPAEKRNFPVGRVYGKDGLVVVSMWKSTTGAMYASLMIKQQIGKDPKGVTMYEQGMNKDIPNVLMRADYLRILIEECEGKSPAEINFSRPTRDNDDSSTLALVGSAGGVQVTVTNKVGTRTANLASVAVGDHNVYPDWKNLLDLLKGCLHAAVFCRTADELNVSGGGDANTPF